MNRIPRLLSVIVVAGLVLLAGGCDDSQPCDPWDPSRDTGIGGDAVEDVSDLSDDTEDMGDDAFDDAADAIDTGFGDLVWDMLGDQVVEDWGPLPEYGDFVDDFAGSELDLNLWSRAEVVREIDAGRLLTELRGGYIRDSLTTWNSTSLSMSDPNNIMHISADVTVDEYEVEGDGEGEGFLTARLCGFFYNDGSGYGDEWDHTGDVYAEIGMTGDEAYFMVALCQDFDCFDYEPLSEGEHGRTTLGSVALGETHRLAMDWDGDETGQFRFQFDEVATATFDPVEAGAGMFDSAAQMPRRIIGARYRFQGEVTGSIVAHFDNVETQDGLYDDFAGETIDPTLWRQGESRMEIAEGTLRTTSSQSYTGVPNFDGLANRVRLISNPYLWLSQQRVAADVTITDLTFIENPDSWSLGLARTMVGLRMQPAEHYGSSQDFFGIRVELRAREDGIEPVLRAFGCDTRDCFDVGYDIPGGFQRFDTPIEVGETYSLSVEYLGGGTFIGRIDDEARAVDLSSVPQFNPDNFMSPEIRTQVLNVNDPGDFTSITVEHDNVVIGAPDDSTNIE